MLRCDRQVGCAHKLEQVLRDGYVKLVMYERAKEEASTLVNAEASQDVASSSSSDLARPATNVAPKPKPVLFHEKLCTHLLQPVFIEENGLIARFP